MNVRMLGLILAGFSFPACADMEPLPVDVSGMEVERIVCASVEQGVNIDVATHTRSGEGFRHWVVVFSYDGTPYMIKNRKGEENKVTQEDFLSFDGTWRLTDANESVDRDAYAVGQFQVTAKELFELGECVAWTPPTSPVAKAEGEQKE
jgi:hypothetical protein